MIDGLELERMRQRYDAARRAVETVYVHASDGLYGELPPEEAPPLLTSAVESVRDVPRLITEVKRLAPASYAYGQEECAEGDCDHVDREAHPHAECPELEERVARLGHVKQAEFLHRLVLSLRRRLAAFEDPNGLVEAIDEALEEMAADDDIREVTDDA